LPIIFITGHGDVPTSVRAMKRGAIEFLTKPFGDSEILNAIGVALDQSHGLLTREAAQREVRNRYQSLTARELEVMTLVVSGRLNKQIAAELRISQITVKAHRGRVMRKMAAPSLADLVRMTERVQLPSARMA
jgi:FixJ family two-component response regulator